MKSKLLLSVAVAVMTVPAWAGDLINKDSKKYDYRLSCGGGTTVTSISGSTTQSGKVKAGCVIDMSGSKYTVKGNGTVTIKGGKISE